MPDPRAVYVPVTRAFEGVGPQMWRCVRCHTGATYTNPLRLIEAPADSRYSHLFVHEKECPS